MTSSRVITVSESDEGVDLSVLGILGPGGGDEEGSNSVSVDGEEHIFRNGIDAGLVEGVRSSEVVPVFSFEVAINSWPDIEDSWSGSSLRGGHRGAEGDGRCFRGISICGGKGKAESNKK